MKTLPDAQIDVLCQQMANFDTYSRKYTKEYVSALSIELDRVALASWDPDPQQSAGQDGLGNAEKRFVEMFAEAYAECFEISPSPEASSPFALLLDQVVRIAGLDMSVGEADLRVILGK